MGCTRFAPTPSGFLHEGNMANFMLVKHFAKSEGLRIRLRIDDLDRSRFRESYLHDIFDVLNGFGLGWDEGPRDPADFLSGFSQHSRLTEYEQFLVELRTRGLVYACRCTRSTRGNSGSFCSSDCAKHHLSLDEPDNVWLCRVEPRFEAAMYDHSGSFLKHSLMERKIGDFVVRRRRESALGRCLPSYQLASLVDDVLYGTTLIVRGADLFDSSLKQLWLAHCLDLTSFKSVRFVHHELLLNSSQQKLSKSAGNTNGHGGSLLNNWRSLQDLEAVLPVQEWIRSF